MQSRLHVQRGSPPATPSDTVECRQRVNANAARYRLPIPLPWFVISEASSHPESHAELRRFPCALNTVASEGVARGSRSPKYFPTIFSTTSTIPHRTAGREPGTAPYIANGAMRSLRAVYNHARKTNLDLPPVNPVTAIDWNTEQRRDTGMGTADMALWFAELAALTNPIRREFHLMTLLSGSRPTALKNVRIEHIDFRSRLLHIPKPKGGVKKAFDIPLSQPMIRCILRAMRAGRILNPDQAEFWLFPADSDSGHLIEHKEEREVLSKWGNDLRQSYRTLAQAAGVSELDIHLLMNHSLPGVNAGYITRDSLLRDHLRNQQERISKVIIHSAKGKDEGSDLGWLQKAKVAALPVLPEEELKKAA